MLEGSVALGKQCLGSYLDCLDITGNIKRMVQDIVVESRHVRKIDDNMNLHPSIRDVMLC